MISKEQKRSDFALNSLIRLEQTHSIEKEFANFIVGTPTMILENGFAQTMAFLLSKCAGELKEPFTNKYYFTFQTIAGWSQEINNNIPKDHRAFFTAVSNLEQREYLMVQEEALKMLQWLKRYARAFQKGE
ncbi:MAG: type III-B CRISPR module-associated protein Cmr5 [Desulfobacula sp.]|jgi:CRISPR-associated protein Cmr5|nr:type III-B CRISPR module-associated protein Cmr5 [Desulfobacula sp.]